MSFESSLIWIDPGVLCFGEKPGRWRAIQQDLAFLQNHNVRVIISLREQEELQLYLDHGFEALHFPMQDFCAPSQNQIDECMKYIAGYHQQGKAIYLHCYAGIGRSGTMATAWLIYKGMNPVDAISLIRRLKPGTVESEDQYNSLLEYAARLQR